MNKRTLIVVLIVAAAVAGVALAPLPGDVSTRVANSVRIARPIDIVFTYVTTPGNWPHWHPSSLAVSGATDHSLKVGEQVTEDFRVAGRTGRAVWTVTEFAFPDHWTIAGTIGGRDAGSVQYRLSTEDGRNTQFVREFAYRTPNLFFVLLNWLSVRRQIEAESEQAVRQLKQVLESAR